MSESASLKTAKPKTAKPKAVKPSSATVQGPATAIASAAGVTLLATPDKTTPQDRAPFSTGSPLLDSFISSSAEKPVYIPNPHIVGDRFGSRQGPSFKNVTLNGPTLQPPRTRFDGEDFKRAGIASAAVPIKKTKSIQLKSQPPKSPSEQQQQTAKKNRQPNPQAEEHIQGTESAQRADKPKKRSKDSFISKDPLKKRPSSQPKPQQTVQKPGQRPAQSVGNSAAGKAAAGKSAESTAAKVRQRPPLGTQGNAASRRTGPRPTAAPGTPGPGPAPAPNASPGRVYGGSDYKALQSRAAAGGLVDLEDTLLFGGAEDKSSPLSIGNAPPGVDSNPTAVLEYLLTLPSDFTLTKPEGNRAILDDFSWLERPAFTPTRAVIDARNFKVVEQPSSQTQAVRPRNAQARTDESAELKALTQKIDQLHQRIEYLSKRLASLDAAPAAEGGVNNGVLTHAEIFDLPDTEPPQSKAPALFEVPGVK